MLQRLAYIFCILSTSLLAQTNTDVFVMDIAPSENGLEITNFKNISNNPGYDNQPSFAFGLVLYAGTKDTQTDIQAWQIKAGTTERVNKKTSGGEYSPQLARDGVGFTAVRLDTTGLQRLYYYDTKGESFVLIKDLQVAYYTFYDKKTVVSSVLSDDQLDLVITDLPTQTNDTILKGAGRSIHKIPDTEAVSYTVLNEEGNYDIYQIDMKSRESFFITELPIGIQDYTWLNDSQMILGSGTKLFIYDTLGNSKWEQVADLSEYNIKDITRLAASQFFNKLSLVAEPVTD